MIGSPHRQDRLVLRARAGNEEEQDTWERGRCARGERPHRGGRRSGTPGRGPSGAYRPRYEAVAGQILDLIGELALRPGDRLPTENDLASRLGTSRTVVRDAVKILSASGRVSAQKGRGLYVADGESMLRAEPVGRVLRAHQPGPHLHAVRVPAGPGGAGEQACRQARQPVRVAGNRGRRRDLPPRAPSGDDGMFKEGDDAFHLGVATASHNFFLVSAVREARALQRRASVIGTGRSRRRRR